jgi:hypothetical protein
MSKPLPEKKIQDWKKNIHKQQKSNLSIERWCRENNILPHNFHYWKRKLLSPALSRSSFTELVETKRTGLFFEYQGIRLYVDLAFDRTTLKQCLEVLRGLIC